jgi:hypothetical protein
MAQQVTKAAMLNIRYSADRKITSRKEKLKNIPYITARRRTLTKFLGKLVLLSFLLQQTTKKYDLSRGRISYAKVELFLHLILLTKAG